MMELTSKNLVLYAAQHYYNPTCIDSEEFFSDLKRFKYVKRLLNKYVSSNELSERLILNHLIVIFNVFGNEAGVEMLALKIEGIEQWNALKPFLIFLKAITNDDLTGINMDKNVIKILRDMR
jgi:hypothetical protein